MDDRYIVSAMRGSALATLAGLAGAYDKYASPLYSYCCWSLGDPVAAADAVRDTFRYAMTDLPGIRDPELLRAHLYAVARDECQRLRKTASLSNGSLYNGNLSNGNGHGGLRGFIIGKLAGLDTEKREVVELLFRHGLSHADL